MGNLIKSWCFFTALLLFLLTVSVTLPELGAHLFGNTETQLEEAVDNVSQQAKTVWAQLLP